MYNVITDENHLRVVLKKLNTLKEELRVNIALMEEKTTLEINNLPPIIEKGSEPLTIKQYTNNFKLNKQYAEILKDVIDLKKQFLTNDYNIANANIALRLLKNESRFKVLDVGYVYPENIKDLRNNLEVIPVAHISDIVPSVVYRNMFTSADISVSTIFDNPMYTLSANEFNIYAEKTFTERPTLTEFIAFKKEVLEKTKRSFNLGKHTLDDLEWFNESYELEMSILNELTEKEYDAALSNLVCDLIMVNNIVATYL